MRTTSFVILLLCAIVYAVGNSSVPLAQGRQQRAGKGTAAMKDTVRTDSLGGGRASAAPLDTTRMDSLQLAIYRHNKVIDDSIRLDSINRQKKNGIDAPVVYEATDSLVYDAQTRTAHLYGSSSVDYEAMNLKSDKIYMSLDSSLVHATGSPDSTQKGGIKGRPVFTMGQDKYDTDTMAFNFKTKKGLVQNAYTEQEDGYLTSKISKRNDKGEVYLAHGRYTTCDH